MNYAHNLVDVEASGIKLRINDLHQCLLGDRARCGGINANGGDNG